MRRSWRPSQGDGRRSAVVSARARGLRLRVSLHSRSESTNRRPARRELRAGHRPGVRSSTPSCTTSTVALSALRRQAPRSSFCLSGSGHGNLANRTDLLGLPWSGWLVRSAVGALIGLVALVGGMGPGSLPEPYGYSLRCAPIRSPREHAISRERNGSRGR
jgi:hypothetical protein